VDRTGAIYVDETRMTLPEFRAAFRTLAGKRAGEGVYLRGDAGVPYGVVTQVLATMRAAGVSDIGLVTDPDTPK
jgi:biopolymer transport protein ExbD